MKMIPSSKIIRYLPRLLIESRFHLSRVPRNRFGTFSSSECKFNVLCPCQSIFQRHPFSVSALRNQEKKENETETEEKIDPRVLKDPTRDRRIKIPVETSIRYMKSAAYKECYGEDPVWKLYRRNHKGPIPPEKTRKMCIRHDVVVTGNPCPICRDEYLVVDYQNLDLLKQFISPINGEIYSYTKTGVCQQQHNKIIVAYLKAKDYGLITYHVPFRSYDYSEYQVD